MSHKRKGQLTVSGEWVRHLRPFLRRLFWKSERKAEKSYAQSDEGRDESASLPSIRTVEDLLATVAAIPVGTNSLSLWVPQKLTLQAESVPQDLAMAIILDKVLEKGLFPQGFASARAGRTYKYARPSAEGDA
jgi:hypothetical protein